VTAPDGLSHLTVGEAAPILGLSTPSVRRLCARGILTGARRHGRDWEIPAASVRAYAAAARRPGRPRLRPADDDPIAGSDHELAAARQHQRRASQFRDLADAVFEAAALLDQVLARDDRDHLRAGPPQPGTVAAQLAEANAELRARAHAAGIAVGVLRQLAEEEELAALAVLRGERAGPSTGVLRQLDMLARSADGARQREALRGLMDALYDAGHDGLADLVATATS
jgi:excisionase family DNA binding protein